MSTILPWVVARLAEPSTWAGLAFLASGLQDVFSHGVPNNAADWIRVGTQVVGGAIAAGKSERR